jgi:spore maturation protein CgeB
MTAIQKLLLVAPIGQYAMGQNFLRAFQDFIPEVTFVNYMDYFPLVFSLRERIITRMTVQRRIIRYNRAIIETALHFKPDIVVIAKGIEVKTATLAAIKEDLPSTQLVNINYDDFFSRSPSNYFNNLDQIAPLYDWIFPSKKANVEELIGLKVPRVHYLPLGYDETVHYPVSPNREIATRHRSQVVFAGTFTAERAKFLEALADYRLSIRGGHWRKNRVSPELWRWVRQAVKKRLAWGPELSAVLNESRIALNFFRPDNRDTHNHRTFELPACGVFTLSQRSDELYEFFEEGSEIAMFSSVEELREKVSYYLDHDRERKRMARAAHKRLIEGKHTIRDRVEKMMEIMS